MFTLQQIKDAHSKVKSGADFPAYIRDLKALNVKSYETFVSDGHSVYSGFENDKVISPAKYDVFEIADKGNVEKFHHDLKAHQQGKTDYLTFCSDCAKSGVEKWMVSLQEMTCTYYDKAGNSLLTEAIPE